MTELQGLFMKFSPLNNKKAQQLKELKETISATIELVLLSIS